MKYLYCFIGLPCSGKSYAAKLLAAKFGATYIATGDIARELSNTEALKQQTAATDLFPLEDLMRKTIQERIQAAPDGAIVLDGFPRFGDQANWMVDELWLYQPEVIEVNAGDVSTLVVRARARARDTQDTDQLEFLRRLNLATNNMSEVYAVLNKRLVQCHTLMSGSDDIMIQRFQKIARTKSK